MAWSKTSRHERGYGTMHERIREHLLRSEPLCRICASKGKVHPASIADHVVPLSKGGSSDISNYQPLCKRCHTDKTAQERGYRVKPQIGADGWPI